MRARTTTIMEISGTNLVKQVWKDGDPPARRPRPDRIFMIAVDFMFH